MRTYADSLLERKIVRLSQELKSLKTSQKYLTGETKGYKSNILRVDSKFEYSVPGEDVTYYVWTIYIKLSFIGEYQNQTAIPSLQFQLYNSSGQAIEPEIDSFGFDSPLWEWSGSKATQRKNEQDFMVCLYFVTTNNYSNAFYGDFWCVANMTGRIELVERLPYPNE